MKMRHMVRVNIADGKGKAMQVLKCNRICLPEKVVRFLFGDFQQIVVLTPGESVQGIEIHELSDGGGTTDER